MKKTSAEFALFTLVQFKTSSSWQLSGLVLSWLLSPPLVRMEPAKDNPENILNKGLTMILRYCVTRAPLLYFYKELSSTIFQSLSIRQASVTPDQISTVDFSDA